MYWVIVLGKSRGVPAFGGALLSNSDGFCRMGTSFLYIETYFKNIRLAHYSQDYYRTCFCHKKKPFVIMLDLQLSFVIQDFHIWNLQTMGPLLASGVLPKLFPSALWTRG